MGRTAPEITDEAVEQIRQVDGVSWAENESEWLVVGYREPYYDRNEVDQVADRVCSRLNHEPNPPSRDDLEELGIYPPDELDYDVYFLEPSS